jgi:MFS family permease
MILMYFEDRLGDMYGHKKIFLVGSIWFGVWSLIASFSVYSGTILFSICRGFQGIGPALVVPNALAIAGRSFQGQKNIVFSLFGACAPGILSSECFAYNQELTKCS